MMIFGIIFILSINLASAWWFSYTSPPPIPQGKLIAQSNGTWNTFIAVGTSLSGGNGTSNRVLTLNNTQLSSNEYIIVGNAAQIPTVDYSISNGVTSTNITFLNNIYDSDNIQVNYMTSSNLTYTLFSLVIPGSSLTGTNGSINRDVALLNGTNEIVNIDGYDQIRNVDYVNNGTTIRFINNVYNSQNIQIRYYRY
jgi:hypothetical protein